MKWCDDIVGYRFRIGDMVRLLDRPVIGIVLETIIIPNTHFVHCTVSWTGELLGIVSEGWSPCEICPVDPWELMLWKEHHDHPVKEWHECAACRDHGEA